MELLKAIVCIFQELIEKLSKRELSRDDYPCMNDPSPTFHGTTQSALVNQNPPAHSMRSRRTATWARARTADDVDGYSRFFLFLIIFFFCSSLHIFMDWITCNVHSILAIGNISVDFKLAINFFFKLMNHFSSICMFVEGVTYLVFCPMLGHSFCISELIIFLEL